jgi:hypothetical protein
MHTANLSLRLFLELAGLTALGYRGYRGGSNTIAKTAGRT